MERRQDQSIRERVLVGESISFLLQSGEETEMEPTGRYMLGVYVHVKGVDTKEV